MKKILLALLALGVSIGAAAAPLVRNPLPIDAGIASIGFMDGGDFNGDGHKDVVAIHAHEGTRVISVLLANGTGPFAEPVLTSIDPNYGPYDVGIGDVNEDGKTDLVLSKQQSVGVMLGNGDGTFTQGPTFPGSAALVGPVTLADFNGDQNLDVAVGIDGDPTTNNHAVAVHFGNGAGSFSSAVTLEPGSVWYLEPLDINADGRSDLLVGGYNGNKLYVADGNGGFTANSGTPQGEVASGDFNHDGKLDLAVPFDDTSFVKVWFGNGDGSLTEGAATYPVGYWVYDLDAKDIDGDGNLDLLSLASASTVTVLRGKPDGTFHAAEGWVAGPSPHSLVADDFDRDGKIDFVTSSHDTDLVHFDRIAFVRGNGDGTFQTSRTRHSAPLEPEWRTNLNLSGGRIADLNGDEHPDAMFLQKRPFPSQIHDIGVMLNDGTGRLAAPILSEAGINVVVLASGDVNNDGKIDVVTNPIGYPTPQSNLLLGNGDGTFGTPVPFTVTSEGAVFLGDFVGDTNLDLFVHSSYHATVYPGNGSGGFGSGIRSDFGTNFLALPGDLNDDGKMDWIGTGSFSKVAFVNDGTGHFTSHPITTSELNAAALADFNGDDKLDVLMNTYVGIETWLGNGDGTFAPPIPMIVTPRPDSPAVTADFDGDDKIDVAFGTSVYLGTGDGRFRSRARVQLPYVDRSDADDMDGNGSPDLVAFSSVSDDVAVFLTRTTSDPTATSSVALSSDQATGQYARAITFTAKITGGLVPLTGAVTFAVDGAPHAIVALDLEGNATWTTAFAAGSYEITATYAGDENYLSSTKSMTQSIAKGQPTASIFGGPNPRPARQTVSITVGLSATRFNNSFAAPTGALTLRDGDTPLNLTITNGKTSTRDLAIGTHVISVDYPGDANYEPATASYTQVITKPVPTVIIEATPDGPIHAGTTVKYRAYFLSTPTPTGTITFLLNDVVQAVVPLTNGEAEIQLTPPWGHHGVVAKYSGDEIWAEAKNFVYADVLVGPWGTPVPVDASATGSGSLSVRWGRVTGGVTYTLWRKKSLLDAWESIAVHDVNTLGISTHMDAQKTWMFAMTVADANGNVSPMGPPDLATAITFTDSTIVNQSTKIKAAHLNELRTAINSVRTFAGLVPYAYTNAIVAGKPVRKSDVQEMRTALAQARSTIGLPAISFTDPTLTSSTLARAIHITQLRSGTN